MLFFFFFFTILLILSLSLQLAFSTALSPMKLTLVACSENRERGRRTPGWEVSCSNSRIGLEKVPQHEQWATVCESSGCHQYHCSHTERSFSKSNCMLWILRSQQKLLWPFFIFYLVPLENIQRSCQCNVSQRGNHIVLEFGTAGRKMHFSTWSSCHTVMVCHSIQ